MNSLSVTCSRSMLTIVFFISLIPLYGQIKTKSSISGKLLLDSSWSSNIYLSHISTFDDMYVMSNEIIIAKTVIDSLGYFNFNIDYLPIEENLFRLHIVKKNDSPATLIIGGKDENHLFLIADRFSAIHLTNNSFYPPFKSVIFENSNENIAFQQITHYFFKADSVASESSASKRLLIEKQLEKDLFLIADTSNYFMVSLYAIYKNRFSKKYSSNKNFYQSYLEKWRDQNNPYFHSFKKEISINTSNNSTIANTIISIVFLTLIGFAVGRYSLKKTSVKAKNVDKLSIQERRIYEMIQQGASNQEISDQFHIGLSTVKSHISSIYSKLNVKSRKDILNMKSN
jgi:DNA-binding CsgD family transcriptional regulator